MPLRGWVTTEVDIRISSMFLPVNRQYQFWHHGSTIMTIMQHEDTGNPHKYMKRQLVTVSDLFSHSPHAPTPKASLAPVMRYDHQTKRPVWAVLCGRCRCKINAHPTTSLSWLYLGGHWRWDFGGWLVEVEMGSGGCLRWVFGVTPLRQSMIVRGNFSAIL